MSSLLSTGRTRRLAMVLLIMTLLLTALPTAAFAAPAAAPMANGYHVVKPGQTLSGIAKYYGVTVHALARANGISNPSRIYVGQKLHIPPVKSVDHDYGKKYGHGVGCTTYHYVQKGDTLSGIGKWFGVSTSALAAVNGISNASHIRKGQRICIPSPYKGVGHYDNKYDDKKYDDKKYDGHYGDHHGGHYGATYRVKHGDSLSKIARWYGVSVHYLVRINHLANANHIYVGQVLRVG